MKCPRKYAVTMATTETTEKPDLAFRQIAEIVRMVEHECALARIIRDAWVKLFPENADVKFIYRRGNRVYWQRGFVTRTGFNRSGEIRVTNVDTGSERWISCQHAFPATMDEPTCLLLEQMFKRRHTAHPELYTQLLQHITGRMQLL